MAKVYAVKKGRKVGIFKTWKECEAQVKGYSGAEYKSFTSEIDAVNFVSNKDNNVENIVGKAVVTEDVGNEIKAYVDGSYNISTKEYGSGVVILFNGTKEIFSIIGEDKSLADMRNVAGEIKGAEIAMNYAVEKKADRVVIYHDYEGVEKWCTGSWKANKEGTKQYKRFYDEISKKLAVTFVKVKAHTGDMYNEEADQLAKKSIGL